MPGLRRGSSKTWLTQIAPAAAPPISPATTLPNQRLRLGLKAPGQRRKPQAPVPGAAHRPAAIRSCWSATTKPCHQDDTARAYTYCYLLRTPTRRAKRSEEHTSELQSP